MSEVQRIANTGEQGLPETARFHRVELQAGDSLMVTASDKPTAVWIPSGYTVLLSPGKAMTLDISEMVEHDDIVSLDQKLREMRRIQKRAEQEARRAKRRLRRGERPTHPTTPEP